MEFSARVNLVKAPSNSLKAFATLIIDNVIEINGFRVISGSKGLFVSAPQRQGKEDASGKREYIDDVRYRDFGDDGKSSTRDAVSSAILTAYYEVSEPQEKAPQSTPNPTRKKPMMERISSW